jgi:hypothetical protein
MKNTLQIILLLGLLQLAIYLQGCREKELCQDPRNSECENYNPCIDFKKTSADFTIQEELVVEYNKLMKQNISCDTVLAGSDVFFTAKQNFDSYTWRIVGDPNFERTGKQFKIWFDRPMNLRVQLIGKRKPNLQCDPFDTGMDTFTRTLVVLYSDKSLLNGTFEGVEISEPDNLFSFTISATQLEPGFNYTWRTSNFPNSCSYDLVACFSKLPLSSYKLMYTDCGRTVEFGAPICWFMVEGDRMIVDYSIIQNGRIDPRVSINKQFIGKRK